MKLALPIMILIFMAACQPTSVLPTLAPPPTVTRQSLPTSRPTITPHPVTGSLPTSLPSPLPTVITASPVATIPPVQPVVIQPASTIPPGATLTATPVLTRIPDANAFSIGRSSEGREILAWRFGTGERILLIVGGVHAGFESNTVLLVNELITHFQSTPASVLPGMSLVLVPVLNPDGLARGRRSEGRFNANGVDLNRNWGCGWSAEAYWQTNRVDPGVRAFSEPETQSLANFVRQQPPASAIFFHSAASGVFAGRCEGQRVSEALAAVYGEASGYPYGEPFSAYPVTGTAASWMDGQGIPAVDLELSGTRDTEFVRNLRALMAVQCWLSGSPSLPQCTP